ncbi:MAG TPA: peptidase MA family metallohydrolase [Aggregatilineales bacterium]|nr:hypothetical protein [Anaerolineales bacterium]HRE46216.1 peptidase MA family metallohydrolase [Aggregatilineales bacterium]
MIRTFIRLAAAWIITVGVIALSSSVGVTTVHAGDSSKITILEETTTSVFRRYVRFDLHARIAEGRIVKARIIYQTRATGGSTAFRVTDFTPGQEVTLSYLWYTRYETTPPFQMITYRWELQDDTGQIYLTPRQKAEITDTTRDWQSLNVEGITVYWYDQDAAFGESLLEAAQAGYTFVKERTGFTPEDDLRIVVYNDFRAFCSIFTPGMCLDWYAGVTFGGVTVQWLIPDERDFVIRQVVPHELAHAFLNDWLDGNTDNVPRWFNEGQATNNELEGIDEEIERARQLAMMGNLDRLPILDRVAIQGRDSSLKTANWYAQSASLVAFLYEQWGADSLGKIIERVRTGEKFTKALADHTGLTLEEFELAWREWLGVTTPPPTLQVTPTLNIIFPPTPTYEPTPMKRP